MKDKLDSYRSRRHEHKYACRAGRAISMDEAFEEMYIDAHGGSLEDEQSPKTKSTLPCACGLCLPQWCELSAKCDYAKDGA